MLDNIGVTDVTSANRDCMLNPDVYVILIESGDRSVVYGGARVHLANGKDPLPVVDATMEIDKKIIDIVNKNIPDGTGEICGLWNSLEVAGYGIGSTYAIRSAICILPKIKAKTCFALCSPYTARISSNYGFVVEKSLGNDGTFYYPKLDLLATIVFVNDSEKLETALEDELMIIRSLREQPSQETQEAGPKGIVHVTYDLKL